MKIIHDLKLIKQIQKPIVAAAGFFDGVHLGHQKVIGQAITEAKAIGGQVWVITFQKHPMSILNPTATPPLLTATEHKLNILERSNIDGCLLLPFNKEIAETEPGIFVQQLLDNSPPLAGLVVGQNWHFGKKGKGNPRMISQLIKNSHLNLSVVRPRIWKGETISSTRIRTAVLRGNIEDATAMLGRPFSVLGTVQHGSGIGHSLGFPTANLNAHHEVLPPFGVYAARMLISNPKSSANNKNKLYNGILNFGIRPTFSENNPQEPILELHIMNFAKDLYNKDIEIFFVAKIRNEKKFQTVTALRKQISNDVIKAETILTN
jgi:riboflavin kinase/FMN adenylyltransferase